MNNALPLRISSWAKPALTVKPVVKLELLSDRRKKFTWLLFIQETVFWWQPWHSCLILGQYWWLWHCPVRIFFEKAPFALLSWDFSLRSAVSFCTVVWCTFSHMGTVCVVRCGTVGGICLSFVKWEKGERGGIHKSEGSPPTELPQVLLGQFSEGEHDCGRCGRWFLKADLRGNVLQCAVLIHPRSTAAWGSHSGHSRGPTGHLYSSDSSYPSTLALAFTDDDFASGSPGGQDCDVSLSLFKG